MPYLFLTLGLIIGGFALFQYMRKAGPQDLARLFLTLVMLTLCIALLFLAVTERLPAALAVLGALWPIAVTVWNHKRPRAAGTAQPTSKIRPEIRMSREEALDLLGLKPGAPEVEIREAHKRLMLKVHPDHGGTDALAARINAARDTLLS